MDQESGVGHGTRKFNKWPHRIGRDWYPFSVKGWIVYILHFAGHVVSRITRGIYPASRKAAIENIQVMGMPAFQKNFINGC